MSATPTWQVPTLGSYPPVLTKQDFIRRYQLNEFGNRAPTWNTLGEFLTSGYRGLVHLRNRIAGGPTWYDVPTFLVEDQLLLIDLHDEEKLENIYFSGMAPTDKTLFQGELMRSVRHFELYYSTVPKPMRDSLREGGIIVWGSVAVRLLQHYLCPNSLEWLYTLLDRYPGHVVEFSTYDCCWGTIPNFNSVFWEVRKY